jgi:dTDP-4-dehydrorhamnose reductase
MKILVIGGSGLIGNYVLKAAKEAGHSAVGTFRNYSLPGLVHLDGSDLREMQSLLDAQRPEAIVYAAGWTWVDGCEENPARAFAENAEQPLAVAKWCRAAGSKFVYLSTSYVFDGAAGPYGENAIPNPINVYARSKLQGEQTIAEATSGDALIARVIFVYGAEAQAKNFACQVSRAMESGTALTVPSDQMGNPTYAADIGRWLIQLVQNRAFGLWNLAGPNPNCSKAEWGEQLAKALQAAGVKPQPGFAIKPIVTAEMKQRAPRPLHGGILTAKADALNFSATPFDESIAQVVRDMKVQPALKSGK